MAAKVNCALIGNRFSDEPGEIFIRVHRNHTTQLIIGDTGVGLPPELDFETTNCFGLKMIKLLSTQVGASIRVDCPGTVYTLELPASLLYQHV